MSVEKFHTAIAYCLRNKFQVNILRLRSMGFFNGHEIHSTHFTSRSDVSEYNITVGPRPFSNQVMLLTDQCSRWLAICADPIFYNCNSLLLVFITCNIIVIIIVVSFIFLTEAI